MKLAHSYGLPPLSIGSEVVCTNWHEVYFFCKLVCKHSCCRVPIMIPADIIRNCNTFSKKVCFSSQTVASRFFQERNHWEHDTQLTHERARKEGRICVRNITQFEIGRYEWHESQGDGFISCGISKWELSPPISHYCPNSWFAIHSLQTALYARLLVFCWGSLENPCTRALYGKINSFGTVGIDTFHVFGYRY